MSAQGTYAIEGQTRDSELAPELWASVHARLVLDFRAATTTIPIVETFIAPVEAGIVSSVGRPGGNITGVSGRVGLDLIEKRVQLFSRSCRMRPDFGYSNLERWETDGKLNGARVLGCIGSPTLGRRSTVQ